MYSGVEPLSLDLVTSAPASISARTTAFPSPLLAATQSGMSHGQPFACAHCSTSSCPPSAASRHVYTFHLQPFARAHCRTSRCPPSTAAQHVPASNGQRPARNNFSFSSCPLLAAALHRSSLRDRRPASCRRCTARKYPSLTARFSSSSLNRSPVAATMSRVKRLTAGRRARSAGSAKFSDRRMCATTRWFGRPRKASCAFHGQPFARAHCSNSRCPPSAALVHVFASHGQPFARDHCITSRCPPNAAH